MAAWRAWRVLCGIAYGTYWAFIGRFEESTDDTYVAGKVVPLMTRVNGTVIAIRADDTQRVKEGQPLVLLYSTVARIALDQAEARLAQAVRLVQGLYGSGLIDWEAAEQVGFSRRKVEQIPAGPYAPGLPVNISLTCS